MLHFDKTTRLSQRSSTATSRIAQNAVKDRLLNGYRVFMFARARILVSILSVLCALCGNSFAQQWKAVADGVEYAEVRREFSGKPVNINLLRLDLKRVRLDVHHAMDAAIGTEKTSSIAMRHKAFAAINAGFFRLDKSDFAGDPSNTLIVDGRILSEEIQGRSALFVNNLKNRSEIAIHRLLPSRLYFKVGKPNFKPEVAISGLNRERKSGEVVLYSSAFGSTTPTGANGTEVVLSSCSRHQENRGFWFSTCAKFKVLYGSHNTAIPKGGYVISFAPDAQKQLAVFEQELISHARTSIYNLGRTKISYIYVDDFILGLDEDTLLYPQPTMDAVSGVPQLVKNSKIDITWEQEKSSKAFVETRHPRTAVAKLKDGKFLMLTADGRTEQSAGLDLYDLAAYFLELGATDAMNLDGGGSTTMFLDGKLVNKPSDKEGERKVGDAILVTLRKPRKKN